MAEVNSFALFARAVYPSTGDVLNTAPIYGDPINVLQGTYDPGGNGGLVNAPRDLREGVLNANGQPGTLKVPRVGRVIAGVEVDDTVGTYVQITAAFVSLGSQWGEDGTEYTGTLDTGCPVPDDPDKATVLVSVIDQYGKPAVNAQVHARTKYWVPFASSHLVGERKNTNFRTNQAGQVELTLIKASAFDNPAEDAGEYLIGVSLGRHVQQFSYYVTDSAYQHAKIQF